MAIRILLLALTLSFAPAVTAEPLSLADFLSALDTHPDLARARSDLELARAVAAREEARTGLQAFGGMSGGGSREPQYTGGVREYTSLVGNAGVRYPVFGSAGEEQLRIHQSRADALLSEAQGLLARERNRQTLRAAFYDYAANQAQQALAQRFLENAAVIEQALLKRADAGLVRAGDHLELVMPLALARSRQAVLASEAERLGAVLRRVRPEFDGQLRLVAERGQAGLASPEALEDIRTRLLRETEALQQDTALSALRGNVYVAGELRHESDLGNTTSVNAGIVLEVPVASLGANDSWRSMVLKNSRE